MQEILEWSPDQESYLEPLAMMSCKEARRTFAMPVLWISCFACYMGTLSSKHVVELQKAKSHDILEAIEVFRDKCGFAPGIKSVAQMLEDCGARMSTSECGGALRLKAS